MIKLNYFNDEIGKIIVIFIISPIILFKAFIFQDLTLAVIGALLFIYDLYWFYNYHKINLSNISVGITNKNTNNKKDNIILDKVFNNDKSINNKINTNITSDKLSNNYNKQKVKSISINESDSNINKQENTIDKQDSSIDNQDSTINKKNIESKNRK